MSGSEPVSGCRTTSMRDREAALRRPNQTRAPASARASNEGAALAVHYPQEHRTARDAGQADVEKHAGFTMELVEIGTPGMSVPLTCVGVPTLKVSWRATAAPGDPDCGAAADAFSDVISEAAANRGHGNRAFEDRPSIPAAPAFCPALLARAITPAYPA